MAKTLKTTKPVSPRNKIVLTIQIDPLRVGRGHLQTPRGGAHRSARHPNRARSRQQLRRDLTKT